MGSFSCRRFVFALKDCTWPLRTAYVFNWPFCTLDVFNLAVFVLLTYCGRLHHDFGRLFVLQMCVLGGLSEWMFITSQRLRSNVFNLETIQQFKMLRQFLITYQYKVLFLLLINKYTVYIFALYSSLEHKICCDLFVSDTYEYGRQNFVVKCMISNVGSCSVRFFTFIRSETRYLPAYHIPVTF